MVHRKNTLIFKILVYFILYFFLLSVSWKFPRMHTLQMLNSMAATSENPSAPINTPMDGAQWVELLVREIRSAANMDEARNRTSEALVLLEKFICVHATSETSRGLQQETIILKEQSKALIQENNILKRAVSIQHERLYLEGKIRELDILKQTLSQYQEQLRCLEVNNYSLRMHLQQAQQSNPISGRFHPDVF